MIVAGVIGVILLGSISALFIYYQVVGEERALQAERQLAFEHWLARQRHEVEVRVDVAARTLKPVYEDLPAGRSNPEQTQTLIARYAPTLRAAGAQYIWCRKTWKHGNQTLAVNLAPEASEQFLPLPARAALLTPEPLNRANINGEPSQSATAVLYWDLAREKPIAVATLVLAPPRPSPAPGQPPPEGIPPTVFTLWFDLQPLDERAWEYIAPKLASTAPGSDAVPTP